METTEPDTGAERPEAPGFARLVGRRGDPALGNTLLVVGGIHGNEPAGIHAAETVLTALEEREVSLSGELVVLAGNTRALARGVRFLQRDLNRGWSRARIDALIAAAPRPEMRPEDCEEIELAAEIDATLRRARGKVYFLDLHTTSSRGYPFILTTDGAAERAFAYHIPLPIVLGMLDKIDNVIARYLTSRGAVALSVEGGQNADPASVENHAALLWLALGAAGILPRGSERNESEHRATLTAACYGCPRILEVVHRHAIRPGDGFVMAPGFANIERVARGTLLAHDAKGEITAEEDGILFLPLYQGLGDDGFFFGREVDPSVPSEAP